MLHRLQEELATAGIVLAFTELKDPIKARLRDGPDVDGLGGRRHHAGRDRRRVTSG